jgi:hypothetical protein
MLAKTPNFFCGGNMIYIPLFVLFFLSAPTLVSSQSQGVITMPRLDEVSEITFTDNTPRYFSVESLRKLLPCFFPINGGHFEAGTQQGLLKLKSGRSMRWAAANAESITLLTDKTQRSFRLSSGCSAVTQTVGKHKGLLKKVQNYGNLIVGANFELVLEKTDSNPDLYRAVVYVTAPDGRAFNLYQTGYAGIRLNSNGEQISIELGKGDAGCTPAEGCFRSVKKFAAASDLQVEVVIAFPGKQGTGIAVFEPF